MTNTGSTKPGAGRSQGPSVPEEDAFDRLYRHLNSPRQRQAQEALRDVTVEDLRQNYQPGGTETGGQLIQE